MADKSSIEWTDATWPIVQGCDPVSPGCVFCYAVPLLWRMAHNPNAKISAPLKDVVEGYAPASGETILRFTGKIALREDRLDWPLKWKKGRMIFVPSHGDIFHKDVPDEFIDKIFAVMALCPQHTFQVLTKRAERMRAYLSRADLSDALLDACREVYGRSSMKHYPVGVFDGVDYDIVNFRHSPLPNVWLGVSCERQQEADERRDPLRALAAQGWTTFVSYEPALGPVDWSGWEFLRWLISGGESGPKARPSQPDWHRAARDWCARNGVAYFFKQWGAWAPDRPTSGRWKEFEPTVEANGLGPNMWPVGKKAAGRLLDGREWNEMPSVVLTEAGHALAKEKGLV